MMRGAILAGGGATRFGGYPKGLSRIAGVRIVDRLANEMQRAFGGVPLLVANAPDAAEWATGLDIRADVLPGSGVLGGLLTAIEYAAEPVVCAAWDMPFLDAAFFRCIGDALQTHDVAIPASSGPRGVEPLAAAYGPRCAPAIRAALGRGDHRAISFHDAVDVRVVTVDEWRPHARRDDPFFNVNTAADLTVAEAQWLPA